MKLDIGIVFHSLLNTTPKGCLLCDGASLSTSNFSELFNLIGYRYQRDQSGSSFQIPNLDDRFIRCSDRTSAGGTTNIDEGPRWAHGYNIGENPTPTKIKQDVGSNQYHMFQAHLHKSTLGGPKSIWGYSAGADDGINGYNYTTVNSSIAYTGLGGNNGAKTYPTHISLKTYISYEKGYLPICTILPFGHDTNIPDGWLLCQGGTIPSAFSELIGILGLNIPDFGNYYLKCSNSYAAGVAHQIQAHKHGIPSRDYFVPGGLNQGIGPGTHLEFREIQNIMDWNIYVNHSAGGTYRVDDELRPKTTRIKWIIKAV